jgi:hypothetical protein
MATLAEHGQSQATDTSGLVKVNPGWQATRFPAPRAFCSRKNDNGPTTATP